LSGETEVVAFSPSKGRSPKRWTVAQLYKWSQDPRRKGRLQLIRLRSLDKDGRLVPGRIKNVFDSGKQEVFEVKTRFGRSIKATAKHRFLTSDGWKPLSKIAAGDKLFSNGVPAHQNPEWIREHYLEKNKTRQQVAALAGVSDACLGKWIRNFGLQKPHGDRPGRRPGHGVKGMHTSEGRREISERMSGENNHQWRGSEASANASRLRAQNRYTLPRQCETCGSYGRLVRHHVDGDTYNNTEENIMFLCECCHHQWHTGQAVMSVFQDEIVSITPAGLVHTYDIEMAGPNHNFVANGLVVHNSQESQRWCDYGKRGLRVICPSRIGLEPGSYTAECFENCGWLVWRDGEIWEPTTEQQRQWIVLIDSAYSGYLAERKEGIPPEDARYVLPNATKTEVATTFNLRQWRHFFRVRCDKHAQWEIREIAKALLVSFAEAIPSVFEDLSEEINSV
jgi:thymidylate synthase (FAD)